MSCRPKAIKNLYINEGEGKRRKDTWPNHSNKNIRNKLQVYEQEKHPFSSCILAIKKCRATGRIARSKAES